MASQKNEEYVLAKRHEGQHDLKNAWKLQECPMPKISDGEYLCESLYLSVDPYLSSGLKKSALGGNENELGTVQQSLTIVKVIESKNSEFPVGTIYASVNPWKRYFVAKSGTYFFKVIKRPNEPENYFDKLGIQAGLGALGMPSQTAYYGCTTVGKFGPSDVLVVSGAAGAVGSVVGQISKHALKVKKVIGTAGGKAKCDYLVKELGFDAAVDYKEYNTQSKMAERLKELAGEPITAYFDNTGGFVTDAIFDIIGKHGKIVVCGQISAYNEDVSKAKTYPNYLAATIYRGLSIFGYVVGDYIDKNEKEFYVDMPKWIEEGKVKTKDHLVEGFEKMPEAYEMLYTGANIGKIIVKA